MTGGVVPVYDRTTIPASVGRGTLDPELAAWLPTGPTLGADVPIAHGRRDHTVLGEGPWPPIGAVDTLVLPGRHGSLTVRRLTPTDPANDPIGALVYVHGGGFTYGTPTSSGAGWADRRRGRRGRLRPASATLAPGVGQSTTG
jgi:acetyl esterase/lipase